MAWWWILDRLYLTRLMLVVLAIGLVAGLTAEPEIFDIGAPFAVLSSLVWKTDRHLWFRKRIGQIPGRLRWAGTIIVLASVIAIYHPFVKVAHMTHTGHWGCEFGKVISGYPH
jgi:uncharacterized membrane protein